MQQQSIIDNPLHETNYITNWFLANIHDSTFSHNHF